MKKLNHFLVVILLLVLIQPTSGNVLHVPSQYSSIQAALLAAWTGDTVLVAPGHYYENIHWPPLNGIKLISSGDTTNTVIDGNNLMRVFIFQVNIQYDTSTLIRGFTIINGYDTAMHAEGGGILLQSGSNMILENLHITHNTAAGGIWADGGGIYCMGAHPVLRNLLIDHNSCHGGTYASGGGIAVSSANNATLKNIVVKNNECLGTYALGGGINIEFSNNCRLSDLTISNNYCEGTYAEGGGLFCEFSNNFLGERLHIFENTCVSNAYAEGGGLYFYHGISPLITELEVSGNYLNTSASAQGAGVYFESITNGSLTDSHIHANSTADSILYNFGGCLYFGGDSMLLQNVIIDSNLLGANSTYCGGGGIYCSGGINNSSLSLSNTLIHSNSVGLTSPPQFCHGGAVYCSHADMEILNSTFTGNGNIDNQTINGSGIYVEFGTVTLKNTITWNENAGSELAFSFGGNLVATYSDIRDFFIGTGNINALPQFVGNNDFHLQLTSPCINAGDLDIFPVFDLENNPRPMPVGSNPDMGAYEMDQSNTYINQAGIDEILVYPNPFSEQTIIDLSSYQTRELNLQIFSSEGMLLRTLSIPGNRLVILYRDELAKGVYFLKLSTPHGKQATRKLIVL